MSTEVSSSRMRAADSTKCARCKRMIWQDQEFITWKPVFGGTSEDRILVCDECIGRKKRRR